MGQLNPVPVFGAKKRSITIWRTLFTEISVQMVNAQDLHCSSSPEHCLTTSPPARVARLLFHTLFFQYISYCKTHLAFGPYKVVSLSEPSRIQWKISKLATFSVAQLFFLLWCRWYWGRFYENEWKNKPFRRRVVFQRETLTIRIFYLIMDFSK